MTPDAPHRRGRRGAPATLRLGDMAQLREQLRERERAAALAAAREQATRAAAERERRRFVDAVGRVHPVPQPGTAPSTVARAAPEPLQTRLDERAALREALSDSVDIETLLLTDDGLSFRREGVGVDVVHRLRRGHWAIQAVLDLHGLRRDEARERVGAFMREAQLRGWRCLRVVHGKGHGSPAREPVLKAKVHRWLGQHADVLAFTQASGPQGGAGALIVLRRG